VSHSKSSRASSPKIKRQNSKTANYSQYSQFGEFEPSKTFITISQSCTKLVASFSSTSPRQHNCLRTVY